MPLTGQSRKHPKNWQLHFFSVWESTTLSCWMSFWLHYSYRAVTQSVSSSVASLPCGSWLGDWDFHLFPGLSLWTRGPGEKLQIKPFQCTSGKAKGRKLLQKTGKGRAQPLCMEKPGGRTEGCEDQPLSLCWLLPSTTSNRSSSSRGPKLLCWAMSKRNWMP